MPTLVFSKIPTDGDTLTIVEDLYTFVNKRSKRKDHISLYDIRENNVNILESRITKALSKYKFLKVEFEWDFGSLDSLYKFEYDPDGIF